MVIGVPTYGRSFLGVGGPGETFAGVDGEADGRIEYRFLPLTGTEEVDDPAIGAASCDADIKGWITYDNPMTVTMEVEFTVGKALGGLMYYTGSLDPVDDHKSLIHVSFGVLSNGK